MRTDGKQTARIGAAVSAALEPYPRIERRELDDLADAAEERRLAAAVAYLELRDGRVTLLKPPTNAVWTHFAKLATRASADLHLPPLRMLVSLCEGGRCLPDATAEAQWFHLSGDRYAARASASTHPEAAQHPSIFAPSHFLVTPRALPIFSIASVGGLHTDLLYPGAHATLPFTGSTLDPVPWADKSAALYWRGSSTGGRITIDNFQRFPRVQLALQRDMARGIDVGITSIVQAASRADRDGVEAYLRDRGAIVPRDPQSTEFEARFLFDIDGNITAFRLPRLMRSHCAVVRPPKVYSEYYYRWLEPGTHYLQTKPDLSDLGTLIEWARSEEAAARTVADSSRAFADEHFSWSFATKYFRALLVAYAERYVDHD